MATAARSNSGNETAIFGFSAAVATNFDVL